MSDFVSDPISDVQVCHNGPAAFCPLCKCSHPAAEDHQCVPVADVIVDDTDPLTGETFSRWA